MTTFKVLAAAAALALSTSGAWAQISQLTNGPNGKEPNGLASNRGTGSNSRMPSRAIQNPNSNFNKPRSPLHRRKPM